MMPQALRATILIAVLITLSTAAPGVAAEPSMAPPTFEDLCEIHFITSGEPHNHAYPTCRTWSRDGQKMFVESHGPGPDGKLHPGVQYILAVDIETRAVQHLAEQRSDKPDSPGAGYTFDYAPDANCIVYMDPPGRHLYLLNLDSMKRGEIMHEPEGRICEPPTIASDGTRVAYWATFAAVENRFFEDYTTVIFAIEVDPVACRRVGEPRIVDAYPRRKGKTWAPDRRRDGVHINHPQINPRDRNHLCYSHEMLGAEPDGTIAMSRLWQATLDGDCKRYLIHQPAGLHFTHEVIAPDGRSLIFPYMFGVGQVFFDTLEARSLYYNPDCCPGHLTVSPDMKWIAGDTWGAWTDGRGRTVQSIMMLDVATRRCAHLCWIPRSHGHPGHPHPIFSPDGTKLAFTALDDRGVRQAACIDVTDVQRNWGQMAQGVGGVASPDWLAGVKPRAKRF